MVIGFSVGSSRTSKLADESLELSLLLFALTCRGTQLARPLTSFVHERRVSLSNCDHLIPFSQPRTGTVQGRPIVGD